MDMYAVCSMSSHPNKGLRGQPIISTKHAEQSEGSSGGSGGA